MSRKQTILPVAIGLLFNLSCTNYVRVPESEFDQFDGEKKLHARITRTDGTEYIVQRFEITDESLVIHEFENESVDRDTKEDPDSTAVLRIPRDEVSSIEEIVSPGTQSIDMSTSAWVVVILSGLFIYTLIYASNMF